MSNAAFKKNFQALLDRVGNKAEMVTRKVMLDVYASMVGKSPVDTGRFRGNWQVGFGGINTSTDSPEDKEGSGAIAAAQGQIMQAKLGGVIYLTNSLPYARRLEYGWSQQAPQGMVRLTIAEYGDYLRRQVQGMK